MSVVNFVSGKYSQDEKLNLGLGMQNIGQKINPAELPRTEQSRKQECLEVREIVTLILDTLREVLHELDVGTIRHSIGAFVLASVLTEKLQAMLRSEYEKPQAATADTQTEALVTSESQKKVLELWKLLSDYMEIFLLFILLHDYGKHHIGDMVNSNIRFTDQDKRLAREVLDKLSSSSTNLEVDNSNFSSLLTSILGVWSLPGMLSILKTLDSTDMYSNQPAKPPNLAQQSEDKLKEKVTTLLRSFIHTHQEDLTQGASSTPTNLNLNRLANVDPDTVNRTIQRILIQLHPGQGLLEIAPAIIETLGSFQNINLEQKANIAAITIGVIAGHHISGDSSSYPPVEVLTDVLEKCLNFLGFDKTTEFQQRAIDLMLFTAAFAKIVDVMQAICFDKRIYNQNIDRPPPTNLYFSIQESYTSELAELQRQIDSFLNTLYERIRRRVFGDIPINEQHPVIENYNSLMARLLSFQVSQGDVGSQQELSQLDLTLRVNFFEVVNYVLTHGA